MIKVWLLLALACINIRSLIMHCVVVSTSSLLILSFNFVCLSRVLCLVSRDEIENVLRVSFIISE